MSIATKVPEGFRICESGSATCTGINPCRPCWVKHNHSVLAACVRMLIPDEEEVMRRLPLVFAEYEKAWFRLTDQKVKLHPQEFAAMVAAAAPGQPGQFYWVPTQPIPAQQAAPAAPPVEAAPEPSRKPRKGEVAEFMREKSEKSSKGQVLGRVAFPRGAKADKPTATNGVVDVTGTDSSSEPKQ